MADRANDVLILVEDDTYYAVPRRALERYRVPTQHARAVADALQRARRRRLNILTAPARGRLTPRWPAPTLPPPSPEQPVPLMWLDLSQPEGDSDVAS